MTPVDFDHFKKDIRSIIKEKSTTNLSTFNQLDDIDTRYSFSAGKSLSWSRSKCFNGLCIR